MDGTSSLYPQFERYVLAGDLLQQTVSALRDELADEVENIVFWGGRAEGSTARIDRLFVPRGDGILRHACQIRVDESVIAALCDFLDPPNVVLLGQVHTHLEGAFHSPTDDRFSLDTPGFLSVVVPECGRAGADDWLSWAFHVCLGSHRFERLDEANVVKRFHVDSRSQVMVTEVRS